MIYELVVNNVVTDRIVADEAFMQENYPQGGYRIGQEQNNQEEPEQRHISVGAFYDRFGAQKLNILSSTDPLVQALVKDSSVRLWIDLDRPELPTSLQMLVSKGFTIDPEAIVSAPIQPHERALHRLYQV